MSTDIIIPEALGDKDLNSFFRGWEWRDDPSDPVVIHVGHGTHIAPWAATLFGAYGIWLKEVRGKNVSIDYNPNTYTGKFLNRIGFPQLFSANIAPEALGDERIFPLTRISESKQIGPIASSVVKMLDIGDEEIQDALKYALIELLRNVVQHSRSRIGGLVSAVYFPKSGIVDVMVADIGCGLRASLRGTYPEINSDQKAVRFAMNPHVSGTFQSGEYGSMKDNAGLGLFFIKEIASRAYGGFFLGSGAMLADIWGTADGDQKKKYIQSNSSGWRGTFALLQLRRNSIGEFDALLQVCRDIAAAVRKDPSELAVDFIEENPCIEGIITLPIREFDEDVEVAAHKRDTVILPALSAGELVLLDFSGVRASTQSFIHALMYKVFREGKNLNSCLSVCCADRATKEAVRSVSAYASVGHVDGQTKPMI